MRTVFLLLVVTLPASAEPTIFVSDTTWKASDTVEDFDDWVKPKYDDSKWGNAADYGMNEEKWKHFTVDNIFGFASDANWIWTKADKGGFLRAHFTAPAGYRTAEMIFVADDLAEVWINDDPIDFYDTKIGAWGFRGCAVIVDATPWIADGDNVIAVKVADKGGSRGFACEIRIDGDPLVVPLANSVKAEDMQPSDGKDLFKFPELDAKTLKAALDADQYHQQVSVRLLVAAATLGKKDPAALEKVLRSAEDGGSDRLSERTMRFIGALGLKSLEPTLVEVLLARAGTRAGAFAAAALAKLGAGDDEAIHALEKALHCDYAATERAAKRALAVLKK